MSSGLVIETHVARVINNTDPEKRGRVRVSCVGLLGDDETDLPMWVEPSLAWGVFLVPDVGEIIEIECVTGSAQDESQFQMSIDNLDIRWKGLRYYNTDKDIPTPLNPQFTDTNYGKRRGFATPLGHVLVLDDTPGDASIKLTWVGNKESDKPETRTTIEIDKDGNVHLNILDKHKIDVTPDDVKITLGGGAGLDLTKHDADTVLTIGDGKVHGTVVEHLQTYIKSLVDYIENALVNTGFGPSATIKATVGPAPVWDPKINSTHLAFPDES